MSVKKNPEISHTKKKMRPSRVVLSVIALLLVAALLFTFLTPFPASWIIRAIFKNGIAVTPDNYDAILETVTVTKDLVYPSEYKSNFADIYVPKDKEGPFPIVLWVHGGAFVGGDKNDIEVFATALASEGIAVACINYQLAPEAKYPTPIIQTQEAYTWLESISDDYSIDMSRLVLAGDSAGAHIVSQFAAIQSNPAYAAEMSMEQVVPSGDLKAVMLYCGPFDVSDMTLGSNVLINFMMNRAAWAYFGSKDWADRFAYQATIPNHITKDFPPTFITDGNSMSFEKHGRNLADVISRNGVPVETYFIPIEVSEAVHEYQFIMDTPESREAFLKTVAFIEKYTK